MREADYGTVYLVGSGPGDPGLVTVKGLRLIEAADAVVYDRLAPESLLAHAREDAEFVYVGKRPGDHSMSQEEINATLVRLGQEGKNVVRLKGGDPYIFGRGSEEALELLRAGVPFEVVPGVTSGVAAPAYAGIPVTHRGVSTSVAFVTGHEDPTKGRTDVDWKTVAKGADTLVLYMGVGRLKEISRQIVAAGRPPETPVAVVRWGTLPEQRTVTGTLADIARKVEEAKLGPPAITVVGGVAALREDGLGWFERRPLFGRRIVVTRARAQAGELSAKLEDLGAEVVEFPTIEIVPPGSFDPLDAAIRELDSFDWLVFTSVNGVDAFRERLAHHGLDVRAVRRDARLAAIGPATAERLRDCGLRVDVVPDEFRAEGLLEAIPAGELEGKRVLIPRAAVAREVLPEKLREAGAEVVVPPAYRSVPSEAGREALEKRLRAGEIDCVTFTASSTVENFVGMFGEGTAELLGGAKVACIGPITAETARKHGLTVSVEAGEYTIPGLVDAVLSLYEAAG
ncbi:uroporphyrinogen-III C-methyltransferase [Rubrobacter radiotolerans]|uniref:uroporphyrinogen-III C-methyltransferase n=1 Tax=Rubrobacter radiotolerans TaxID=42256 RepID=A0A023X3V4_RUBRA|nr:uroporphyrinogen-III C-methyltransferase [Rubrobacter radiotolerans]AHY47038.1 uroporphyrinogen-III C-methyltransferase [Rubrobacter radiotolerans]MDX5894444.1 uroporphyrinogen-III C-methyltransferase [Rubrobacter radiotolerans]SMC06016.1 uroporphyrinogen-III synthase /uroporphyrinogen-III C-methyltransferase [Rubrobacter radiotolerans DSM 5868]